jgi:LPS-assembly protein
MQYTLQTNGGLYARVVVGQSLHLGGDNPFEPPPGLDATNVVNFNPASGLDTQRSDYVAGLYLSPIGGVNLIAQGRFDEHDFSLRRQDTAVQATYGPLLTQLGYTFTQFDPKFGVFDNQQEVLGTVGLRLTERWSVVGQLRYDIDTRERVQDILQLKYQDECFVLTASYIETHVENPALEIRQDRTLMLRFELKHLGEYSYRTDALNHFFGDSNQGTIPR